MRARSFNSLILGEGLENLVLLCGMTVKVGEDIRNSHWAQVLEGLVRPTERRTSFHHAGDSRNLCGGSSI
jgi:hypothetical protein